VVEAMQEIINRGYGTHDDQITCGRHCYEDFVYNRFTKVIIDVTGLRGFGQSPERGYYIDVGYGNWDMYRLFHNLYGRTVPAGSCYSVGLGGHITGGGYGFLSRFLGLSIDYVTGADVVTIRNGKAALTSCSENENSDLLWAIRGGGGGNFGIITRYYFADPPNSPEYIYLSSITLRWKDVDNENKFHRILELFNTYECSQDTSTWHQCHILHVNHVQTNDIVLSSFACYDRGKHGDLAAFEKKLALEIEEREARYRAVAPPSREPTPRMGHPWVDDGRIFKPEVNNLPYRRYTYLEGVQALNGSGPNRYGKYKSAYMKKAIPEAQSRSMYRYMTNDFEGADLSASLFQIDSYGGRINERPWNSSAIPQRSSRMKIQYQTYWFEDSTQSANQEEESANIRWLRAIYGNNFSAYGGRPDPAEDRTDTVDGCYFNYCDSDLGENNWPHTSNPDINKAMSLYFGNNYPKLKEIKKKWNPDHWFMSAQSIPVD
jgi:hypothetical protein